MKKFNYRLPWNKNLLHEVIKIPRLIIYKIFKSNKLPSTKKKVNKTLFVIKPHEVNAKPLYKILNLHPKRKLCFEPFQKEHLVLNGKKIMSMTDPEDIEKALNNIKNNYDGFVQSTGQLSKKIEKELLIRRYPRRNIILYKHRQKTGYEELLREENIDHINYFYDDLHNSNIPLIERMILLNDLFIACGMDKVKKSEITKQLMKCLELESCNHPVDQTEYNDHSTEPKVFCIGLNKTGTTSLNHFLKSLGLSSIHNTRWANMSRKCSSDRFLKQYISRFNTWTDGERPDFKRLHRLFPHAKFILNTRPLHSWLRSRIRHAYRFENTHAHFKKRYRKRKTTIENWIMERESYHQEALDYFKDKENQILILDITTEDNWKKKLCDFLGKQYVPSDEEFHLNRSEPSCTQELINTRYNELDVVLDEMRIAGKERESKLLVLK